MKQFFLDTNILIDLIADRKPHSKYAIQLFNEAGKNSVKLYTSSHSIATTYYLSKKVTDEKKLRKIINSLLDYVQCIAVDQSIIKRALHSNHADFEDGIQIMAASTIHHLDAIITRNSKDFKNSDIPVLLPDEAVQLI